MFRILFVTVMYCILNNHPSIKEYSVRVLNLIVNCSFCLVLASLLKYTLTIAKTHLPASGSGGLRGRRLQVPPRLH